VLAVAQSGSPKVEAKNRKAKTVQRLHGVKYDLIMQSSPEQRMRMGNQRRVRRIRRTGIQQRLQPACGTIEEERANR